jgi:hypothetical protein
VATYQQEVKDAMANGLIPKKTHILANEIDEITHLKRVWQQAVEDIAYQHLDLIV